MVGQSGWRRGRIKIWWLGNSRHPDENDVDDDDEDDDDYGLPAHSHHDNIPPWWGNVSNDKGGNVSVSNSHHS